MDKDEAAKNAVIFVLDADAAERERIRAALSMPGCSVLPLDSVDAVVNLLENGAACDLIVLSTDSLGDDTAAFDRLLSARAPTPQLIVCGVDPRARAVLHCLNAGARDFVAKPLHMEELVRAVETALEKDGATGIRRRPDSVVASSPVGNWLELTASSELEQFRRIQRFSDALFDSRLPERVCEDLKMAVEEVGRNAVEWGNHFDPDKRVHISYCMFDDRVVIKVEDEGEGFKPHSLPDPTADPLKTMRDRASAGKRPGGYGVFLIQKLVDDIVYSDKGNTVLLIKYLPEK